jgi:hypothetical protein
MKKPQKTPANERQLLSRYVDTFPAVATPRGPLEASFSVLLFVGGRESPCLLPAKNRFVHLN